MHHINETASNNDYELLEVNDVATDSLTEADMNATSNAVFPHEPTSSLPQSPLPTSVVTNQTTNMLPEVNKLKCLLVDDSQTNRRMLGKLLGARGHICEEAADGSIAVEMVTENLKLMAQSESADETDISKRKYDAIFMDVVMPVMNGLIATAKIRKLGYTGLIVGLTGNALRKDQEEFKEAGASFVLTKPLKMAELREEMHI